MNTLYVIIAIIIMTAITFFLRAFPFLMPTKLLEHSATQKLAKTMPLAVMVILVVNSFGQSIIANDGTSIPMAIAIGFIIIIHLIFRIALLSIATGTALYMLLLNIF